MNFLIPCTVCEQPVIASEQILSTLTQPYNITCNRCKKTPQPVVKALQLMNWRIAHLFNQQH